MGVLPGIIGSLQALEVIKVITGVGEILNGRLFNFDALSFQSRLFNIRRSPDNPLNGAAPTIHALIDYEQFCGVKVLETPIKEITASELHDWQRRGEDFQLIDVREPNEYSAQNINALLMPLGTVTDSVDKIDRNRKVVVHCKAGSRSSKAVRELEASFGFDNLYSLKGGIDAYMQVVGTELS